MRSSRAALLAVPALVVLAFAGVASGLTAWGGPSPGDPAVVAAQREATAALEAQADGVLAAAGTPLLDRSTASQCVRGSRAAGGLGVDTPYRLRCTATVALQTVGGPLATWDADVVALHERLVAAGWQPRERALPQVVDEVRGGALGGGRDGQVGPADAAAVVYTAGTTELSVVLSERGERPAGPTDADDVMGWATADRLPPGGYGVVLRVAGTTFED